MTAEAADSQGAIIDAPMLGAVGSAGARTDAFVRLRPRGGMG